jgi:hypothetical protein
MAVYSSDLLSSGASVVMEIDEVGLAIASFDGSLDEGLGKIYAAGAGKDLGKVFVVGTYDGPSPHAGRS